VRAVVEDYDDTRALMKYLMELRGIKVLEAKYDDKALETAQRESPRLILMDLNLGLTALKTTRRIRADARLRDDADCDCLRTRRRETQGCRARRRMQ